MPGNLVSSAMYVLKDGGRPFVVKSLCADFECMEEDLFLLPFLKHNYFVVVVVVSQKYFPTLLCI